MRNHKILLIYIGIIFSVISSQAVEFRGHVHLGHNMGKSFELSGTALKFAGGLPIAARLGIQRSTFDPGNAIDARKIFINNNQGGTIEKSGLVIGARLDFLLAIDLAKIGESYLFFGVRTISFKGNFKYIGNNEDFDITSKHWGWGVGTESGFPLSRRVKFLLNAGIDYFRASTLYGHDTSYSPDGSYNNQRENYTYTDADRTINQPKIEIRVMLGFSYRL